jgi:hypothetical protein
MTDPVLTRIYPYMHGGQYFYTVHSDGQIEAPGHNILDDDTKEVRSDDKFLIENAGRMLQTMLALDSDVDCGAITLHPKVRKVIRDFIANAYNAGIDIIALSEDPT